MRVGRRQGDGAVVADAAPVDRSGSSPRLLELARLPGGELETVFLRGHMPELERLAGWEFRGMNTPRWARTAGIRKFVKGFERRDGGQIVGYNRPVEQDADDRPWRPRARRFGWYRVAPVDATARDNAYLHAVLLDYGRGGNRPWDPTRGLRDYLVQIESGDDSLYLGKAYYAVGPIRLATNFFLLERMRPTGVPRDSPQPDYKMSDRSGGPA